MNSKQIIHSLLACSFIVFTLQAKTFTLEIEATYPADQAKSVYKPLKTWLEKKTGHTINIITAENYYFYWRSVKGQQADFTLDAPHIAAYRMSLQNYQPIARVKENLSFHIISSAEPTSNQSLDQFMVGKKIIILPNPSLASLLFDQWFIELFLQPQKLVTALSWEDTIEQVFEQTADAAIVPDWLFRLYPNFASLKHSKEFPGMTFLASPNIDETIRDAFKDALMSINTSEKDDALAILSELNTDGFTEIDPKDYKDLDQLLTDLLY